MLDRALVLAAVVIGVGLAYKLFDVFRKGGASPERLSVDDLELELMAGCCAFVVFTTPTCRPCKAVLRVLEGAISRNPAPTEIRTVDASARGELANRYHVRTVPTTFLITASGHVVSRWKDVPTAADVDAALARI
ncbi:MAG: thioredoxin 1 [Actinomycetota bacterium]|jgi:glutaredoxin|nr:thioredoxin 1 [Actinomycetota bacterium]